MSDKIWDAEKMIQTDHHLQPTRKGKKVNLFTHDELLEEIKNQGRNASLEYPNYIQIGNIAFGRSLGNDGGYSWNDEEGLRCGNVPALATVQDVIAELFRQIDHDSCCGACGQFFPIEEAEADGFHSAKYCEEAVF